ncbi:MAG TPA: NADH-quinone oxidoreductase subunit L [Thermoanaerobaculia bacterium]|jgi:NADH-quinone oxidoreductase subunit L|nr:NADH-quinone oxidoreductase subunit L [Thermoanaerobaculia bacterium]
MLHLLWLIPILPLAGAAINGLFGRRYPKSMVTAVGVGMPLLSLLIALGCLWQYGQTVYPGAFEDTYYLWTAGPLQIPAAFLLDALSAVMLFVVTFVGFLIHVYSAGYMGHEEGYSRYFSYLNLFMAAMLLLVLGNNYLVMFVGWEGVGLCSYLLIGFYYDQPVPPAAGKKAFIVNRIGDFAFLVGMFALFAHFGSLTYHDVFPRIAANPGAVAAGDYALGLPLAGFVALCFFVGAMGKSAQIPLYVWLPDAMAGPTPVSALIHAATMVTAGVYMVVRSNVIYQLAPGVSMFVAIIGASTAIFAATIGIAQTDIKKVLAYSTVSQLGYMFLAAGLGAYTAALFHVMTHAFFKALLFLGSGSVIHAMGGEQDMRQMGGLKSHMPSTRWTYLIGALAIAGVPGLAGFFSKDEILHAAAADGQWVLWAVGLITAGLTACYMFRSYFLTFEGKFRGTHEQEHHLHESPPVMTIPLWILAVGAVLAGYVGVPKLLSAGRDLNWFHHWLEPVIARPQGLEAGEHNIGEGLEWALVLITTAVALAGIFLARSIYGGDVGEKGLAKGRAWAQRFPGLHRLLENKYYVDEIYGAVIVRPLAALSRFFWKVVDTFVIDGAVGAGAFLTELTGDVTRFTTTGNVRNYALYFFVGVILLFWWIAFG